MSKYSVPHITSVAVTDSYLAPRIAANHTATIPASLKFSYDTGRIDAFKLTWKKGDLKEPHVFWDSDVAKVVEGMCYDLVLHPEDKALADELDRLVSLIVSAQQPDGYLNTHFTVVAPEDRWKHLAWAHELYCAGHLTEAAIAHFHATGKRNFLDCMCRYCDYIDSVFGRGKGKKRGYPGHEELELALCKLAEVTGRKKYFKLAQYFIEARGSKPNYFVEVEGENAEWQTTLQNDVPVRERHEAAGHAVRMMYLACGMADIADKTGDAELLGRCSEIFESVSRRRCSVTGGIGATRNGEAFDRDYKLVNLDAYNESCGAMGLVWFLQRMHNITGEGRFMDLLERVLYNATLSGISISGDHFFYQNPLRSSVDSPYHRERVEWFGCSCCPTNYCRFLPQIGQFIWSENDAEVRLNIPAPSEIKSGARHIRVTGGYPFAGDVRAEILAEGDFAFSLRIPGWCRKFAVARNGRKVAAKPADGYVTLAGLWKEGDVVDLALDMPVQTLRAHAAVDDDAGKIALARGPLVYAFESVDNGDRLHNLIVPADQEFKLGIVQKLPDWAVTLSGDAFVAARPGDDLYSIAAPKLRKCRFTAIPYALWQNRGSGEMTVWVRELMK